MPMGKLKRNEHREAMFKVMRDELESEGYWLVDKSYINNATHMTAICPREHLWDFTRNGWTNGKRCRACWIEDSRLTQEQVAERLRQGGCELLGTYTGCEKPFQYRCSCGALSSIRLHDWNKGVRCARCGGQKARITLRENRRKAIREYMEREVAAGMYGES